MAPDETRESRVPPFSHRAGFSAVLGMRFFTVHSFVLEPQTTSVVSSTYAQCVHSLRAAKTECSNHASGRGPGLSAATQRSRHSPGADRRICKAQLPGATTLILFSSTFSSFFLTCPSPAPMAYRQNSQDHNNPFAADHYGAPQQQQQQYRNEFSEGYDGYNNPRYNDSYNDGRYDTYGGYNAYNTHQPHQTYEQGGYNYNTGVAGYQDDANRNTPSPEGEPPVPPSKENSMAYEHDAQVAQVRPRGKLASS